MTTWPLDPAKAEKKKKSLGLTTNDIIKKKTGIEIGDLSGGNR